MLKVQSHRSVFFIGMLLALSGTTAMASQESRLDALKSEAVSEIEGLKSFTQEMVDMIFSFGEPGFQEVETSRYLVEILRREGFQVEEGIAGMPTAWIARWGKGKPVVSFGSDIDGLPNTSQKPGVAYQAPLIRGAPGHGEGHNSGQAVNVTAALVLKKLMQREGLPGTLVLWPGVAEEQLGSKAFLIRGGYLEDVDAVLFTHVSSNFGVSYGPASGSGLISVEYTFHGDSAHAAGAPWRGRSALDAVELMNQGWNYRREHLRLPHRSHYVITEGGDQPNIVPSTASVWYYFRELDYEHIRALFEMGNNMAKGAALMTSTEVEWRILGSAWPRHFNKVIALTMYENIRSVGLPEWGQDDQILARAVQEEIGGEVTGLKTELPDPPRESSGPQLGGGSDDIGDVSWNVPTVTLRFPANIPNLPGHHWSSAVAMATPIAHKGSTAGAKVMAMTALDLFLDPGLIEKAWEYFNSVQKKEQQYRPLIGEKDRPALHLNQKTMEKYRDKMRSYYYEPTRYETYLQQLGISYPTIRPVQER